MSSDDHSKTAEAKHLSRRRFLTGATSVVGGAGILAGIVPFVSSMTVSSRAQAAGAPVEADIGKLEPGQKVVHSWRGKPIVIVKRTDRLMGTLSDLEPRLADPDSDIPQQPPYCKNAPRSRDENEKVLVMVLVCTHLGCSPSWRPEAAPPDLGPDWLGGFFCPCHGSHYDSAGRVYKGQPAPKNMVIPPYMYVSDTRVKIGQDERG